LIDASLLLINADLLKFLDRVLWNVLQFIRITINKNDDIIKKSEYSIEKPGSERLICSLPGCFYDGF
jgi:hypothetical protein